MYYTSIPLTHTFHSNSWWTEACKRLTHKHLIHVWSSWDLPPWAVGDCVWRPLGFNKLWCGLPSTWGFFGAVRPTSFDTSSLVGWASTWANTVGTSWPSAISLIFYCHINSWGIMSTFLSSAFVDLGLALDRSGWMMLTALALNHASSPAQTVVLDPTIVSILRMWQFTAAHVSPCLL